MASIHRVKRSSCWYCAFYLPDGRRAFRSTGTTDKRKALAICLEFDKAARIGRERRLTEHRAREVIADIYAVANTDTLPSATLTDYIASWLRKKALEVADTSHAEYATAAAAVLEHFKAKAQGPVDAITKRDAHTFRDALAARVSGGTTNKYIKILRVLWNDAVRDMVARENVFKQVDPVKFSKANRRAFTMQEIKRILDECGTDWRGMVIAGLYTGQRMGDLAGLTWRQVDLDAGEIHFVTRKTKAPLNIPIARPLLRYIMERPSADDPDAALFPTLAGEPSNTLSRQFSEILQEAGLIVRRDHGKRKQGRSSKRATGGLSFHCLRHTATSLLKNAGVSDVVAREIIGHESEAVSRQYTHIETDTLREAVNRLPDIV